MRSRVRSFPGFLIAVSFLLAASIGAGETPPPPDEAPKKTDGAEKPGDAPKPPEVPARPSGGTGGAPGVFENQTIRVGDRDRQYRLVVPPNLPPGRAAPVIFGFHAYRGEVKKWLHEYSTLDALANEKSLILVYPLAPVSWSFDLKDNPDVAFFDALLKDVASRYNVDQNRVYAAGISNGGTFVHLLAAARSDVIAAIVSHSAGLGRTRPLIWASSRKYPALIVHGDADTVIPVASGRKARDFYKDQGHPVEYLEFPGLKHEWAVGHDIDHTIWNFFLAHPLPPPTSEPLKPAAPPAPKEIPPQ